MSYAIIDQSALGPNIIVDSIDNERSVFQVSTKVEDFSEQDNFVLDISARLEVLHDKDRELILNIDELTSYLYPFAHAIRELLRKSYPRYHLWLDMDNFLFEENNQKYDSFNVLKLLAYVKDSAYQCISQGISTKIFLLYDDSRASLKHNLFTQYFTDNVEKFLVYNLVGITDRYNVRLRPTTTLVYNPNRISSKSKIMDRLYTRKGWGNVAVCYVGCPFKNGESLLKSGSKVEIYFTEDMATLLSLIKTIELIDPISFC